MVSRLELTCDEIVDVLDVTYVSASTIGYTLPPGINEISDNNLMVKSFLPNKVKVKFTVDDIRLRWNLTTNKTIRFTKKSIFYTILVFIESHLEVLSDIPGFIQLIPGSYGSDKLINFTRINGIHLKCDCNNRTIVNGFREPILNSFALSSPPGNNIFKEHGLIFFKKINKSSSSHITFYLEHDDHKTVDFNGKTINFTCQLNEI